MIYLTEGNTPLNEAYNDEIVHLGNNTYQLTFRFPTSDTKWELLKEETFLTADDLHGEQDFYIFEVEKQQGYIQVYANQVISLLNNYIVSSIEVDRVSGTRVLSAFAGSITRANPFSFFSDIDDRHTLNIKDKNAMEVLAKGKHSILGQWGGDMVRNGYNLRLLKNGGSENESLFMYKKNLSSYQHKTSTKSLKTRITFKTTVKGEGENAVDHDYMVVIDSPLLGNYSQIYEDVVEVNDQDVTDEASLIEYGKQYFRTSMCDMLEDNLEISVVGQSDVAVQMFDVVSFYHEWYGLDVRKKITKYTYSPMAKLLKSIGFGTFQSSLANAIGGIVNDAVLNESRNLHQIFEERLKKEIANADRAFDAEFSKREKTITDAIELAKAKAEEVKQELSDTINQRFNSFDNGPLKEAKRRAEEALRNAGASSLLAQEAKRIGLDSVARLEAFKSQTTSAQTALSGDLDALKRTIVNDIRPKQAQVEAEIAKQVEALVQTKKELAGASTLLAQEAKRIELDSVARLEAFKSQTTSAQTALSGDLDALKRTIANDIRPKQAQAETEIAKQVEALSRTKNELAGVKSAQATYEETTTRRLSELTNLANGKASKSELTQTAEELASRIASVQAGSSRNYFRNSRSRTFTTGGQAVYDYRTFIVPDFWKNSDRFKRDYVRISFDVTFPVALVNDMPAMVHFSAHPWYAYRNLIFKGGTVERQHFEFTIDLSSSSEDYQTNNVFIRFGTNYGFPAGLQVVIENAMLSVGNYFPAYQPAYEDQEDRVSVVESNFKQRADSLDAGVSRLTEGLRTKADISSLNVTAENIRQSVKSLETDTQNKLNQKLSQAEFEVRAGSIRQEILNATKDKANKSELTQTAEELASKIASVQASGRNLFLNSLFKQDIPKGWTNESKQTTNEWLFNFNQEGTVWIWMPKFEISDVDTSYSEAPEDIEGQISTVESTFKQRANSLEAGVNRLTEGLRTKADISSLNVTAENIRQSVKSLETDTQNKLNQKLSQAEFEVRAGSIRQEILNATKDKANKSELTQTAEELASKIASVQVGGINLLRNTASLLIGDRSKGCWMSSSGGNGRAISVEVLAPPQKMIKNMIRVIENTNGGNKDLTQLVRLRIGEKYTISCYARVASDSPNANVNLLFRSWANDTDLNRKFQKSISHKNWQKYSFTFTADAIENSIQFGQSGAGIIEICAPKIESGTLATDYSEAPEDIEGQISTVESTFKQRANSLEAGVSRLTEGLRTKVDISALNVTAENIRQSVKSLETDTQNKLNQKLSQAEFEVRAGSIRQEILNATKDKASKSELTQTAEELSSKIASVQVGGRNYIRGTKRMMLARGLWASGTFRPSGAGTAKTIDVSDSPATGFDKAIRLTSSNARDQIGIAQDGFYISQGTYTMSCWVKGRRGQKVKLQTYWQANDNSGISPIFTLKDETWTKLSFTSARNRAGVASIGYVYLVNAEVGEYLDVLAPQLEDGSLATSSKEAPEDIEGQISTVESTFKQRANSLEAGVSRLTEGLRTKADISSLNVTAENIRQSVKSLETDTQNKLNQKLSQAEFEVRAGSIRQEILNATKDKANKSELTQTAEELASKIASVQASGRNLFLNSLFKQDIPKGWTNESKQTTNEWLFNFNQEGTVWIWMPKFEISDVDTSYSEAPEDIEGQISTVESTFKQRANSLEAGVNRLTEGLRTKADISSLNVTAENIRQSVKSLETDTQNKLNQKLSQAEFEVRAGSIRQEILNATKDKADKTLVTAEAGKLREELTSLSVGENLFVNSDFKNLRDNGQRYTANGKTYQNMIAPYWYNPYNAGIPNAQNIQHGYFDTETFSDTVFAFNESDGSRHWKALSTDFKIGVISAGEYYFSADLYATDLGTHIKFGFYYHNSTGKLNFYAGRTKIEVTEKGRWTRLGIDLKVNDDIDLTKKVQFYIYGYNFASNSILYLKKPKVSKGRLKSDWSPALEDTEGLITEAKATFERTAQGLRTDLSAIQEYVNKDGQRQEALQRYTREESTRQATAVRELVNRDFVGKATYQEDVKGINQRIEAVKTSANKDIASQIASYRQSVDGKFTDISSQITTYKQDVGGQISGLQGTDNQISNLKTQVATNKDNAERQMGRISDQVSANKANADSQFANVTNQLARKVETTDFQRVKETSKLYERILGNTENGIADKVARMALTNQLFQVEVGKYSVSGPNLIKNSDFKNATNEWGSTQNLGRLAKHSFYHNGQKDLMRLSNATKNENFLYSHRFNLERNTDYVLNFRGFNNSALASYDVYILGRRAGESDGFTIVKKVVSSKKLSTSRCEDVSVTFNSGEMDNAYIRFDNNGSSSGTADLYITEVDLYKGYKPRTWQPHPEDAVADANKKLEATQTKMTQLAGSWVVENINSAGDIISGINLGANGHNRFVGKLTHITGETLIDRAVIKSAMVDKLKTANFEAGSVTTTILEAEAVTAEKLKVDNALIKKLTATDAFIYELTSKRIFSTKVESVISSSTFLEAYQGRIGGFTLGQFDQGGGRWISGVNQFSVGMGNGAGYGVRTAFWANWGNNWNYAG
uniref:phage tail spike protein n=1 Tax=Streptococcus pneumoniae TaxID=1313 RepID=UPI001F2E1919